MKASAADSAIDIAYWYLDRADEEKLFLDEEKLQPLLYLSQVYFARMYNGEVLMPTVFICDENGFYEPNIKKILTLGRPFMPRVKFEKKVEKFLEEIWDKYGHSAKSLLEKEVKDSLIYREEYKKNSKILIENKTIVEILNKNSKIFGSEGEKNSTKVLLSQNGPVVVSRWHPRKLSAGSANIKEK